MIKDRNFNLTKEILEEYKKNAISNAELLVAEAKILLAHNMLPGAYFFGCASIEESGKAFLAFNSINRNLSNPAVQFTLKMEFENHNTKMILGLSSLMRKGGLDSKNVDYFLELNLNLLTGREKSLYADINDDNTLTLPLSIVKYKAASDSVKLANDSLIATHEYITNNIPSKYNAFDDKSYAISKKASFQKMMGLPDFWFFYISIAKSGIYNSEDWLSIAISRYWGEYYQKQLLWKTDSGNKTKV